MIVNEQKLNVMLEQKPDQTVYYFYSSEEYLVRKAAEKISKRLVQQTEEDSTVIEGPTPSIEEIVMAAGTISFFGTKRVVELPLVQPSKFSDKDLKELCDVLSSTENAVFVLTSVFEDDKARGGKRAQALIQTAEKLGLAVEIAPLGPSELAKMLTETAKELDTEMEQGAPQALLERCGTDLFLLHAEVEKLAAASGYSVITKELISRMSVRNIEVDVFDMVRMVQAGKKVQAFQRLEQLLQQQKEPTAIAAALSGSYVDLYRVKAAQQERKSYSQVHKELKYRGSDWRLKKAAESAARLQMEQLEEILGILVDLDAQMKSSPTDKGVLLESALAAIIQAGSRTKWKN